METATRDTAIELQEATGRAAYVPVVTDKIREEVKRMSAWSLPDDPTRRGWKPDEIRRALYEPSLRVLDLLGATEAELIRQLEEAEAGMTEKLEETEARLRDAIDAASPGSGTTTPGTPTITETYDPETGTLTLEGLADTETYDDETGTLVLG